MARFDRLTVLNTILDDGIVPLFHQGDLEIAKHLASALAQGGCRILEFTNRGDYTIEIFSSLTKHAAQAQPDLIIGAGTVEDAPTAALFLAYGANFIVGSTFNEEVARLCNRRKVAYMPGCLTVTEIAVAEEWGVEIVKLFPGEVSGPRFIKAVQGPRPWTRIMPTGGVGPEEQNLREWFVAGAACVGLGSQLIRSEWIKAENFDALRDMAQTTLQRIRTIRGK
ncbi:MAG: bifunctional 4-hydroxy-2-oxoglutarate aldolase/2-dehydro-3-deoxy-phosphogluconate aldolase [Aggregatilineales bacterium]